MSEREVREKAAIRTMLQIAKRILEQERLEREKLSASDVTEVQDKSDEQTSNSRESAA